MQGTMDCIASGLCDEWFTYTVILGVMGVLMIIFLAVHLLFNNRTPRIYLVLCCFHQVLLLLSGVTMYFSGTYLGIPFAVLQQLGIWFLMASYFLVVRGALTITHQELPLSFKAFLTVPIAFLGFCTVPLYIYNAPAADFPQGPTVFYAMYTVGWGTLMVAISVLPSGRGRLVLFFTILAQVVVGLLNALNEQKFVARFSSTLMLWFLHIFFEQVLSITFCLSRVITDYQDDTDYQLGFGQSEYARPDPSIKVKKDDQGGQNSDV